MPSVPLKPLNEESFAAYGRLVQRPDSAPTASGEGWQWWGEMDVLEAQERPYAIGYLELMPTPLVFSWAERHQRSQELIVPLNGKCVVYVAPADGHDAPAQAPAVETFEAFAVHAGQAVLLNRGVWHGAPFAFDEPIAALVLLLEGSGSNDTEVSRFGELPITAEIRS